ncbi:ABC transporter permease [Micromonospora sp. C51]|uniref:ABC transporter permease n=1 Tax=Micromonospora sp. C51 TaxID=2824879 RepID=UPI001B39C635|nr:ABC transporter permease [Micromonospora sp. C51]MBQ1050237.1 ABC transporter permease [Micromonospora sp. C51]
MRREREVVRQLDIGMPRFRLRDWVRESRLSVLRHPGRSLMTAVGTVLGAAAFVATLGIASTVSRQVSDSFDVRRATEVRVVAAPDAPTGWLAPARLRQLRGLNGVTAAGVRTMIPEMPLSRSPHLAPEAVKIIGADPQAIAVMSPRITLGRTYDEFHERSRSPVIMLPKPVAERLGIARTGVAVFLDDRPYTVIGIYDEVQRRPEAMLAAVVPATLAENTLVRPGMEVERDVLVSTAAGAAQLIGRQSPLALWPEDPAALRAIAPPDPRTLRQEIEGDIAQSSLLLSGLALVIGAVSIANAATASVAARIPEIGLRRAVGGRPVHIFAQLLGETTVLGALGGMVGVLLGISVIAGTAIVKGWTPVLDLRAALVAVAASAAIGLAAGLWPAARAMRIQPVAALQR